MQLLIEKFGNGAKAIYQMIADVPSSDSSSNYNIPHNSPLPSLSEEYSTSFIGYDSDFEYSSPYRLLQSSTIHPTQSTSSRIPTNLFCRLSIVDKAINQIKRDCSRSPQSSQSFQNTENHNSQINNSIDSLSPITINNDESRSNSTHKKVLKKIFENDYKIISQLGEPGQYGTAYKCQRKLDGFMCAVKIINKMNTDQKSLNREVNIMKQLNHKYIIKLHDIYETSSKLYIIMEICRGGELFDAINKKKCFDEKFTKKVFKMLCSSILYLHSRNIIFCDLKPSNILFVDKNIKNSDIKLIDFGMSKVLSSHLSYTSGIIGTPYYTAPEVINNYYSQSADIFSLGNILFIMLFGYPPFFVDQTKYDHDRDVNYLDKETRDIYKLIQKGFKNKIKPGFGAYFNKDIIQRNKISNQCLDLITKLLENDVEKRLTIKEILQHPWMMSSSDDNIDLFGLSLINYKNNIICNKLNTKEYLLKYKLLFPKYIQNLNNLFSETKTGNLNNNISYKQFESAMLKCNKLKLNKLQIQKLFHKIDINSSGYISFNQVLNVEIYDYYTSVNKRLQNILNENDYRQFKEETKLHKNSDDINDMKYNFSYY